MLRLFLIVKHERTLTGESPPIALIVGRLQPKARVFATLRKAQKTPNLHGPGQFNYLKNDYFFLASAFAASFLRLDIMVSYMIGVPIMMEA